MRCVEAFSRTETSPRPEWIEPVHSARQRRDFGLRPGGGRADSRWRGEGDMPEGVEVHHFTFGLITPAFSYAFSVLGSLLALVCTARAQSLQEPKRKARWLILAAWALGGTGIWVMHFMAMLGFSVPDSPVRYNVGLTVTSWVAAIAVTGFGLFIAGFGKPSIIKVILGGCVTGSGVAIMHYF